MMALLLGILKGCFTIALTAKLTAAFMHQLIQILAHDANIHAHAGKVLATLGF